MCAQVNPTKLNKAKLKVLHLGWGNPHYQYRLGDERVESNPAEKDLGILVKEKIMSHYCAFASHKDSHILDCIKRRVFCRSRKVIPPLCFTHAVGLFLMCAMEVIYIHIPRNGLHVWHGLTKAGVGN